MTEVKTPAPRPVAWMYECKDRGIRFSIHTSLDARKGWDVTPLYDHQSADRALLDETLAALSMVKAAMLYGGGGLAGNHGWSITQLNKARPLVLAALAKLGERRHG